MLCHVLASESAFNLQGVDVKADNLACLVGCGAILDVLFFSIAAAGEGILIPAPYYPAFKNDLEVQLAIEICKYHIHLYLYISTTSLNMA